MDSPTARGQCVVELILVALFIVLVFAEVAARMQASGRQALPRTQLSKEDRR